MLARKAHAFGPDRMQRLEKLAPILAIGDLLHQRLDETKMARLPVRLRCEDARLSPRQREIVEHVALGHSNLEIGAALSLSPHTVRNHLARIYSLVGASNRADLVRIAVLVPSTDR